MISLIIDNLDLVAVGLAAMVLATDVLRRLLWRAFPRLRFSRRARKIVRGVGFLELVFFGLALVAGLQLVNDPAESSERLPSVVKAWKLRLERWLHSPEVRTDSSGQSGLLDTARVMKVKDGDSLVMRTSDGESVEARLFGIDAPEYSQAHGGAAKRALSAKVALRKVGFREIDVDSYGRRVVVLYRQSRNINAELVCEGHAWWYRRHARREKEFEDCEATARADRLGLWRDDDPEPPWQWRRDRRP